MKLIKINANFFRVDGGAMFGVVPKKLWQRQYPCDENNLCEIALNCLLIDLGNRKILIDTGAGKKHTRLLSSYGFNTITDIRDEIIRNGYSPSEITDVVLTHLHFDHCGGCTLFDETKREFALTFPYATHWVGAKQWENFLSPNPREDDSYFIENMQAVSDAGKLNLIYENTWLCPEIELRLFNGHTYGQLVPYIHTPQQSIIYVGDVIPLAAAVRLRWISAYDIQPLVSIQEKEMLLKEAVERNQVLFFEHDRYNDCCTIEEKQNRYVVKNHFSFNPEYYT